CRRASHRTPRALVRTPGGPVLSAARTAPAPPARCRPPARPHPSGGRCGARQSPAPRRSSVPPGRLRPPPRPTPRGRPHRPRRATIPGRPGPRRRRRRGRRVLAVVVVLLVLLLAWPVGLLVWADGRISHVPALSGAPGTPGTTFLLAGSDSRADGAAGDSVEGQRADTIMLMHQPSSGPAVLVSLPRDTFTEIPGYGSNTLNAAYSYGGPELLVATVEGVAGLTVDHYVEIGMAGVRDVVDAVGGVELCLDYDVDDWRSDLVWEAGCHPADGQTALAF